MINTPRQRVETLLIGRVAAKEVLFPCDRGEFDDVDRRTSVTVLMLLSDVGREQRDLSDDDLVAEREDIEPEEEEELLLVLYDCNKFSISGWMR